MTCPLCEGDPSFPIDGHTLATDTDTAGENVCSDLRLTWLYKAGQLDHPGKGLILLVLSLTLPQSDDWLLKCVAFAQQYFCNDRMGVVIWDEPHYDWSIYCSSKRNRQNELKEKREVANRLYEMAERVRSEATQLGGVSEFQILSWKSYVDSVSGYDEDTTRCIDFLKNHPDHVANEILSTTAQVFLAQKFRGSGNVPETVKKYQAQAIRFIQEEVVQYSRMQHIGKDEVSAMLYCTPKQDFGITTKAALDAGHALQPSLWPQHGRMTVGVTWHDMAAVNLSE
eukprot:CAMPEP_0169282138 /NCGR_PEP_ID=MMETSP1016-20121227/56710_1 /TAXON_ID=342587 /ORGANISM="Karlodinium micrum, Strain CCMP2283" /LENGTH=282 /DNA_ID=CAMNT_0009370969 /DNA_START=122 /DNA_END=970 /DNA_ORIENTATION=+